MKYWKKDFNLTELLIYTICFYFLFIIFIGILGNYDHHLILAHGDNGGFIQVANFLRDWNLHLVSDYNQRLLWGYPILLLPLKIINVNDSFNLVFISFIFGFIAVYYCYKLYGSHIAFFFAVFNWDWIHRSLLGGNEPLFVALILASLYFSRKKSFLLAALLASLSILVRPMGILLLIGIGLYHLKNRKFKDLLFAIIVFGIIVGMYAYIVYLGYGDPLAHFKVYRTIDYESNFIFSLPYWILIKAFIKLNLSWITHIKSVFWIVFTTLGLIVTLLKKSVRERYCDKQIELYFFILYTLFIFSYSSPEWMWLSITRYVIPVLPMVYFALMPKSFLKDKRILITIGVVSIFLSSLSALNFHKIISNIFG